MKKYQSNYAVGKPYGNVDTISRNTDLEYKKGAYSSSDGVVTFYAEKKLASFSFVYNGRMHDLTLSELKKPLSDRQLIVRAGKFARSVVRNS